jgi:hypothetical protein
MPSQGSGVAFDFPFNNWNPFSASHGSQLGKIANAKEAPHHVTKSLAAFLRHPHFH